MKGRTLKLYDEVQKFQDFKKGRLQTKTSVGFAAANEIVDNAGHNKLNKI